MRHDVADLIGSVWGVVGALWLVLAFRTKRTVESRGSMVRIVFLVVVFAVLVRAPFSQSALHHSLWTSSGPVAFVGLTFVALGAIFAVWARLTIGTNWSGAVTLKENHELIRGGPYAIVRHPIYTALFTMGLGTIVEDGELYNLVLFVAAILFFAVKIRSEERLMCDAFPDEYPEYRRTVKAVIPFVW